MASGRAVYAASQWLLVIIIARLGSPETLGEFTYALAIASPMIVFAQLNLRSYMATDAQGQFGFADYFATRLLTTGLAVAVIIAIGINLSPSVAGAAVLISVATYKAIESISDIFHGQLQKQEAIAPIAISAILHGITAVLCIAIAFGFSGNLLFGTIGIAISWLIILFAYDIPKVRQQITTFGSTQWAKMQQVIKACYPLGFIMGLITLRMYIPIYFLEANFGKEHVGFFSAIVYFIAVGDLITGSLLQAAAPRLAKYYHAKETQNFVSLFTKLLGIAAIVGLTGMLISVTAGSSLLGIFYGDVYAEHAQLLVWVMLAGSAGYLSQYMGLSLTISRLLGYQLLSNVVGALLTAVISFMLIPAYGLIGGALAILGGNLSILFCNAIAAWIKLDIRKAQCDLSPVPTKK